MRAFLSAFLALSTSSLLRAQASPALADAVKMDKFVISDVASTPDIFRLEPVQGTYIHAGKKTEVVDLVSLNANIVEKTGRQIFAKIPGVFVYDMDGAGNQINIAARGLDPHRGWEFNIRKDGVITNSDMYGYPASHYSMPMESIERINLVRGTGSLQYGAQFGGMLNYISKGADRTRPLAFETINTLGSFGLWSTYNAVGGTVGKFQYYAYYNQRASDGYRDNAHTDSESAQITLGFAPTDDLSVTAEWARSNYTYRIPGPLTDTMFLANPTQSTRSRSYFNPDINIPSVSADLKLSEQTRLRWTTSAVIGARNSVLFDRPANVVDAVDPLTGQYSNRQVDIDHFNSYTTELRLLHQYKIDERTGAAVAGVQFMDNDLQRQQLGRGTTGSDFNLSLVTPGWGRDLHFRTRNAAFFVENTFKLLDHLSLNAGARVETGTSKMSGTISYLASGEVPNDIPHRFPLFGAGMEYQVGSRQNIYAGWSQSYRPVIFKDIIPASTYDRADKNLEDADGYNLEAGYRGDWKNLKWDVGLFYLRYNNRLGKVGLTDSAGNFYIYQTNIGDSISRGAEVFVETDIPIERRVSLTLFTSTSFMIARYGSARLVSGTVNRDVSGNDVESAPRWTSRNGATLKWRRASFTLLHSYVGASYADALNTVAPSANGAVGRIPGYGLLDFGITFKARENLTLKLNANNVTDRQYFTKRPLFYPGPGVWPSDGRGFSFSVGLKL